jgi:hypothetical protein
MIVDLVGALADPGVITDDPPPGTDAFAAVIVPILDDVLGRADDGDEGADGYDPLTDDPVVGLPFYGSWPAKATSVPDAGWPRALNVRTTRRVAAGLGARTVRHNQEALMAAAWDQLGSIREAADELNRGRLAAEIGRGWQARVAAVEPGDRLGLVAPLLSFVTVGGTPAREIVAGSAVPRVLLDRVWMRRTPRARGASAAGAYVAATSADAGQAAQRAFAYQAVAGAVGISPADSELAADEDSVELISADEMDHLEATGLAAQVGGVVLSDYVLGSRLAAPARRADSPTGPDTDPRPVPVPQVASVADVADAAAALDPLLSMRSSLIARIPALAALLPAGELPAGLALAPEFTDPLFWDLAELDEDVIVPGLGEFPNNRVRLLAVNAGFVGAYLVGANHEMSREFLWREYPTDLAATFFARFFDYGAAQTVDITPISGWAPGSAISANLPNAAATTVILIRGDLVRRYPEVNVFLAPRGANGLPEYEFSVQPSFEGRLSADALVVGFPVAPEVVLGETTAPEHFVVLEERMVEPRFGLDVDREPGRLTTWDELAWTDFSTADEHVGVGPIPGIKAQTLDGVEWGRNSAHLAAAVHQRPFRRVFPASELVVR